MILTHNNERNSSAENIKQPQMSMKQAIKLQNIGLHIMAHTCNAHTLEIEAGGLLVKATV